MALGNSPGRDDHKAVTNSEPPKPPTTLNTKHTAKNSQVEEILSTSLRYSEM